MKQIKKTFRVWVNNWSEDKSQSVDFHTLPAATAYALSVLKPDTDATIFEGDNELVFYEFEDL